jgi:hypothetical protein
VIAYFDTSALVKAYIAEDGSSDVLALLNLPDLQPGSLLLLEAEMAAALGKAARLFRLEQDTLWHTHGKVSCAIGKPLRASKFLNRWFAAPLKSRTLASRARARCASLAGRVGVKADWAQRY